MKIHLLAAVLVSVPALVLAHGGAPVVKDIRFPPHAGGAAWLMDELGLLTEGPSGFSYLCDDSVSALVGFEVVGPVDAQNWVLSTRAGIFRTEDGGCNFAQVPGALTAHVTAGLLPHPNRPQEFVTATSTLGVLNDVYRSVDGGRTWVPAGLNSTTRVRSFLRAEADPEVIYASHGAGASRSDDGGATFQAITLGPPLEVLPPAVRPEEFRFLATSPVNRLEVYALIERFPESFLVHSVDAGLSWTVAFALEDSPDSLVLTADGRGLLMTTPFLGLFRSTDGGVRFEPVPAPGAMGCLTREPGGDRIWSCGRGRPVPWVAAATDDLGATWQVKLAQYADLADAWDCPAGSQTALACALQCPPAQPACLPVDAGVVDLGLADATAGPARDAGVSEDATSPSPAQAEPGGCAHSPAGTPSSLLFLGWIVFWTRRRRL